MSSFPFDKPSAETFAPANSVVATPQHSAEQLIGQLIDDKYRVDRIIGMGGMGVVVAATQLQLDRTVAIKLVRQDMANDSDAVERLLQEARSAARIRNEHVADVLDFGILPGGAPFIVMEYLEGDDLAKVLEKSGPLPVPEAIDLILQACEAVGEAHLCSIVHRDLKPGNLFIARILGGSPCLKVVDFGISKQVKVGALQVALTTSPRILGTPNYMAPEQMRGHASDPRTDIWALGAIVFEMLTGRQAFEADTLPRLCQKVLTGRPPPLRRFRPDAPEKLEHIINRCLSKKLDERYEDIAHLAKRLAPFGKRRARLSLEHILAMTGAHKRQQTADDLASSDKPAASSNSAPQGKFAEDASQEANPAGISAEGLLASDPVRSLVEPRATSTRSGLRDESVANSSELPPPSSEPSNYPEGPPSSDRMPHSTGPTATGPASSEPIALAPRYAGESAAGHTAGDSSSANHYPSAELQTSGTLADAPHSITVQPRSSGRRSWLIAIAALGIFSVGLMGSYLFDDKSSAQILEGSAASSVPVTQRSGLHPGSPETPPPGTSNDGPSPQTPTVRFVDEDSPEEPSVSATTPSRGKASATAETGVRARKAAAQVSGSRSAAPQLAAPQPGAVATPENSANQQPELPEADLRPTDPWNDKNFGSRL